MTYKYKYSAFAKDLRDKFRIGHRLGVLRKIANRVQHQYKGVYIRILLPLHRDIVEIVSSEALQPELIKHIVEELWNEGLSEDAIQEQRKANRHDRENGMQSSMYYIDCVSQSRVYFSNRSRHKELLRHMRYMYDE